jgi:hypothetical protein
VRLRAPGGRYRAYGQSGAAVPEPIADQDIGANKRRFMAGGAPGNGGKYEPLLADEAHSGPTLEAAVRPDERHEGEVHGAGRGADPGASLSQSTGGAEGSAWGGDPDLTAGIVECSPRVIDSRR